MSCFKHLWLSFWRKDQGLGMIEVALLLPIFLMFAFAIIDFGNYMIVKNRLVSANTAIADAIESNPNMDTVTLESVITRSLGNDMYTGGHMGIAVWTSKEPPTPQTSPEHKDAIFKGDQIMSAGHDNLKFWTQRTLTNPWLGGDPSDDRKPYYVAVLLYRGLPYLTPFPRLMGFSAGEDKDAPYGRKRMQSFTFRTVTVMTCPPGQFINNSGATPVCTQVDAQCGDGQYLNGVIGTRAVCANPSIVRDTRYRPRRSENDCSDHSNSVQVGMSANNQVWCADLLVR